MNSCHYTAQGYFICDNTSQTLPGFIENFDTGGFIDMKGKKTPPDSVPIPNGTIQGCSSCAYKNCKNASTCIVKCDECFKSADVTDCTTKGNCIMKTTDACADYSSGTCPAQISTNGNFINYKGGNQIYHIPCSRSLYYENPNSQWQSDGFKTTQQNCKPLNAAYQEAVQNLS